LAYKRLKIYYICCYFPQFAHLILVKKILNPARRAQHPYITCRKTDGLINRIEAADLMAAHTADAQFSIDDGFFPGYSSRAGGAGFHAFAVGVQFFLFTRGRGEICSSNISPDHGAPGSSPCGQMSSVV